ncbi:hypothetical protein B7494_g4392 [Chlorociboria aeruginascens]|nr:hypothetical protein B7494_g4392 [Chlorociboria aeruginascens]
MMKPTVVEEVDYARLKRPAQGIRRHAHTSRRMLNGEASGGEVMELEGKYFPAPSFESDQIPVGGVGEGISVHMEAPGMLPGGAEVVSMVIRIEGQLRDLARLDALCEVFGRSVGRAWLRIQANQINGQHHHDRCKRVGVRFV